MGKPATTPVQTTGTAPNQNTTKVTPSKMKGGLAKTSNLFHGNHGGKEQSSQYTDLNQNSHPRNTTTPKGSTGSTPPSGPVGPSGSSGY